MSMTKNEPEGTMNHPTLDDVIAKQLGLLVLESAKLQVMVGDLTRERDDLRKQVETLSATVADLAPKSGPKLVDAADKAA